MYFSSCLFKIEIYLYPRCFRTQLLYAGKSERRYIIEERECTHIHSTVTAQQQRRRERHAHRTPTHTTLNNTTRNGAHFSLFTLYPIDLKSQGINFYNVEGINQFINISGKGYRECLQFEEFLWKQQPDNAKSSQGIDQHMEHGQRRVRRGRTYVRRQIRV